MFSYKSVADRRVDRRQSVVECVITIQPQCRRQADGEMFRIADSDGNRRVGVTLPIHTTDACHVGIGSASDRLV